jgi:hypothetical protein
MRKDSNVTSIDQDRTIDKRRGSFLSAMSDMRKENQQAVGRGNNISNIPLNHKRRM